MYCNVLDPFYFCDNCFKRYKVKAAVDDISTECFCFDTFQEAWYCFETIKKHNAYIGFRFLPGTVVFLKPGDLF